MIPLINKQETGVNLRRIMDKCGITAKDVQEYPGFFMSQKMLVTYALSDDVVV